MFTILCHQPNQDLPIQLSSSNFDFLLLFFLAELILLLATTSLLQTFVSSFLLFFFFLKKFWSFIPPELLFSGILKPQPGFMSSQEFASLNLLFFHFFCLTAKIAATCSLVPRLSSCSCVEINWSLTAKIESMSAEPCSIALPVITCSSPASTAPASSMNENLDSLQLSVASSRLLGFPGDRASATHSLLALSTRAFCVHCTLFGSSCCCCSRLEEVSLHGDCHFFQRRVVDISVSATEPSTTDDVVRSNVPTQATPYVPPRLHVARSPSRTIKLAPLPY